MIRARTLAAALAIAGLALTIAQGASAWSPIDGRRPTWSGAAPYELHNAGSQDLGFAMTESIVRQGMDDWTRVACTSLTTSYRGPTSRRPTPGDGNSTIGWIESGWPHDSNAIGVTQPQFWSRISEADMSMNGVNYTWITGPGRGNSVNTYSIVLHEGGHFYGLGHSNDSSATMYFAYSGGTSQLRSDDQNGICALYPGSGGSDCTTTGCPAGQTCQGGTCVTSSSPDCTPCSTPTDCGGGACIGYPAAGGGGSYCGSPCSTSGDCGSGFTCASTSSGRFCARIVGGTFSCSASPTGCTSDSQCSATQRCNTATGMCEARPSTGGPLGADCSTGGECQSGICFAGRCSQSCDWLNPASCPAGHYCSGEATGACTAGGVCVPGSAGAGAMGAACSAATDCQSLYCASGVCSTPCTPGGAVGCGDGFACQLGAAPGCGSCQRSGSLGDPCDVNEDCTSRLCATVDGDTYCTEVCGEGTCPTGFTCRGDGEVAVCVPDEGRLGDGCGSNADCLGGICASDGDDSYCTRLCGATEPCPGRFDCVATDDPSVSVCRPQPGGGCGCSAPGRGQSARGALIGLGVLAAIAAWRRRREA